MRKDGSRVDVLDLVFGHKFLVELVSLVHHGLVYHSVLRAG